MYNRKSLYSLSSVESLAKFSSPRKLPPVKSGARPSSRSPRRPASLSDSASYSQEERAHSRDRRTGGYEKTRSGGSPSVDDSSAAYGSCLLSVASSCKKLDI